MSEPSAGSDVVSMRTRADKRGDRYMLNGSKMWITNGPVADTLVIYAKTDRTAGARGITAFIVEKGFKGFLDRAEARQARHARLRHQRTRVRRIAKCRRRMCSARVGNGVNVLMSGLDYERVVLAGRAARHHAGLHGRGRARMCTTASNSAKPIGRFQLMQAKLADMYVTMNAAQVLRLHGGARLRRGPHHARGRGGRDPVTRPRRATWMALEAIQCLGGNGYINDFPTGRLLRDAKLYEIGAGTSEIRRMLIGREIFEKTR